jgi:hypothetical protein
MTSASVTSSTYMFRVEGWVTSEKYGGRFVRVSVLPNCLSIIPRKHAASRVSPSCGSWHIVVHSVAHPFTNPVSPEYKSCLSSPKSYRAFWSVASRSVLLTGGSGSHWDRRLPVTVFRRSGSGFWRLRQTAQHFIVHWWRHAHVKTCRTCLCSAANVTYYALPAESVDVASLGIKFNTLSGVGVP